MSLRTFAIVGITRPRSVPPAGEVGGCGTPVVTVESPVPGTIATKLTRGWFSAQRDPAAARRRFLAAIPVGRLGTPDDVAALALFLASDESSFVSGTAIPIDGGRDALSAAGTVS